MNKLHCNECYSNGNNQEGCFINSLKDLEKFTPSCVEIKEKSWQGFDPVWKNNKKN